MRRGIVHLVLPNHASIRPREMERGMAIAGYPVYPLPKKRLMAEARGLGRWKWIAVGPLWFTLTWQQQMAVIYHEAGHCALDHFEQRLLHFLLPWTWRRLAHRQEFEADQFAKRAGFGLDLAEVISKHHFYDGKFYPPKSVRIAALTEKHHEKVA